MYFSTGERLSRSPSTRLEVDVNFVTPERPSEEASDPRNGDHGGDDDVDDGERTVRLPRVGQAFGRFIAVKSKMEDSLVLEQSFIAKLLLLRFVTTLVAYVAKDLKQGGK